MKVMEAVRKILTERGLTIMLCGMFMIVAGVVSFMAVINTHLVQSPYLRQAAMTLVFIGFGVYVTGRVSVAAQNRRLRKSGRVSSATDDGDEL